MHKYAVIIGTAVLAIVAALWVVNVRTAKAPSPQGCTMEVKLCPDGSAVGRTGPNCEFAECSTVATTTSSGPVSLRARIGQEVSGLGVRIVPIEVVEDSRCPINVVCIWEGTVRMRARLISGLGEAIQEFKLGQPIMTEEEDITLAEITPAPTAGVKIKDSEYVFRFDVTKRVSLGGETPK